MRKPATFTSVAAPTEQNIWSKVGPAVGFGSTLLLLGLLGYWGGVAMSGPLFLVGVVVLSSMIVATGFVGWWLFVSPLPEQRAVVAIRSPELRQYVALMSIISGLLLVIAVFWDELWHRTYGSTAVLSDFFWRPHLMIYGSMGINSLFAGGALLIALRGAGGIRQRFRAEPLIGLMGLASAFLALSGPSDLIWHRVYGGDISPWSLPHLMLSGSFGLVMILTLPILLSLLPRQGWRGLRGLHLYELLAILLLAIGTIVVMVIMVTTWDGLKTIGSNSANGRSRHVFWSWPEWLYPVVLVTMGVFISSVAIHALRRAGVATLVALTILGIRAVLFTVFGSWTDSHGMGLNSQVLLLPPAIALDIWYALRLRRAESATTLIGGSLLAGAVFLAVALPAIPLMLIYPRINATTVPPMILFGLIMALWSGWVGARTGAWFGALDRPAQETISLRGRPAWVGTGALVGLMGFLVFFIVTASPPV